MANIRIDVEKAGRLIARLLREAGMVPDLANAMAAKILSGLRYAETSRTKPGLKDWRLIPRHPSTTVMAKIMKDEEFNLDQQAVTRLWELFYDQGLEPPDDIDMTVR